MNLRILEGRTWKEKKKENQRSEPSIERCTSGFNRGCGNGKRRARCQRYSSVFKCNRFKCKRCKNYTREIVSINKEKDEANFLRFFFFADCLTGWGPGLSPWGAESNSDRPWDSALEEKKNKKIFDSIILFLLESSKRFIKHLAWILNKIHKTFGMWTVALLGGYLPTQTQLPCTQVMLGSNFLLLWLITQLRLIANYLGY